MKQADLCLEVLRRLEHAGVLGQIVLVGSWCMAVYQEQFHDSHLPPIRTRDLDLLIPAPTKIKVEADLESLFQDLGFVTGFKGCEGYMMLQHPSLILEFLVPERGRGEDKPRHISKLGINAQPLRFMDMLADGAITLPFHGIPVQVPHPAHFAIQKLIVSKRRKEDKGEKDVRQACSLLHALVHRGDRKTVTDFCATLSIKRRREISSTLRDAGEAELAGLVISEG